MTLEATLFPIRIILLLFIASGEFRMFFFHSGPVTELTICLELPVIEALRLSRLIYKLQAGLYFQYLHRFFCFCAVRVNCRPFIFDGEHSEFIESPKTLGHGMWI